MCVWYVCKKEMGYLSYLEDDKDLGLGTFHQKCLVLCVHVICMMLLLIQVDEHRGCVYCV